MSVLQFTFILVFFFVFVISSVTKKNIFICVKFYWEKWTFMHSFTMILCSLLFFFRYSKIMMKNGKKFFVFICSKLFHILTIPYYEPMDEWSDGKKKRKKKFRKFLKKKISIFFPIPKFSCFLYANFSKALQNNNQIFFLC